MTGHRAAIFAAFRAARPDVFAEPARIAILDGVCDDFGIARDDALPPVAPAPASEPAWLKAARSKIGEREIPGPKHNQWILGFWQKLGAPWIKTDDADGAWCGGFVAWCLHEAGLPYPKNYPAAGSFADWGMACKPRVGAIGVKSRKGGNHVFLIVGETKDKTAYKALGGNQGNQVSIIDILKSDVTAVRWPTGAVLPEFGPLPVLPKGTIGASEA